MRLMLGIHGAIGVPSLLVDVSPSYIPTDFEFDVINGNWIGRFKDGKIWVEHTNKWYDNYQILSADQDRLRGDYNTVFNNFRK
jgi:hypothetical protein